MPASRGSHCAPTPRARASSSLPGPSSPVLPLYILCDVTCEQICKSGVKVYKKLSKNALHYGAGPSFWTAQFSADLVKRTYHTKHGGGAPGRASPRPSSRRPPTAGQQLANWGITTTLPSRRQRSLCGPRPIRRRLANLASTCFRVETRYKAPLQAPGTAGSLDGEVLTNKSSQGRADAQRLVATRPLDRLHDPLGHFSRLQRIYPRAR